MGAENGEFRVTPQFKAGLQKLYIGALNIYLEPMIPWEALKYEPDGVFARAGKIAQACETIYREMGLEEELDRTRQEAILESGRISDYNDLAA